MFPWACRDKQPRWEIEERRREERERAEALMKEADAWAQARRLREYVDAAEIAQASTSGCSGILAMPAAGHSRSGTARRPP